MGGMTPITPICHPLNAEVPGNLKALLWERKRAKRRMGSIPPMNPLSLMPPIRLPSAEVLGNIRGLL